MFSLSAFHNQASQKKSLLEIVFDKGPRFDPRGTADIDLSKLQIEYYFSNTRITISCKKLSSTSMVLKYYSIKYFGKIFIEDLSLSSISIIICANKLRLAIT